MNSCCKNQSQEKTIQSFDFNSNKNQTLMSLCLSLNLKSKLLKLIIIIWKNYLLPGGAGPLNLVLIGNKAILQSCVGASRAEW